MDLSGLRATFESGASKIRIIMLPAQQCRLACGASYISLTAVCYRFCTLACENTHMKKVK
jgi:hypothetical protein